MSAPKNTVMFRGPAARLAFFTVGDEWFVNLTHLWGHPLAVDLDDLAKLIRSAPSEVIIARRLDGAELRTVLPDLRDLHEDILSRLIPNDTARWLPRRKRRGG